MHAHIAHVFHSRQTKQITILSIGNSIKTSMVIAVTITRLLHIEWRITNILRCTYFGNGLLDFSMKFFGFIFISNGNGIRIEVLTNMHFLKIPLKYSLIYDFL